MWNAERDIASSRILTRDAPFERARNSSSTTVNSFDRVEKHTSPCHRDRPPAETRR